MITTHSPRVERVTHRTAQLPGGAPLTIVQVSDVHASTRRVRRMFERAVRGLPTEADLVVITGDCLSTDDPDEARFVAETLGGHTQARIGRFAVMGNHDYLVSGPPGRESPPNLALGERVVARLEGAGFRVLRNAWTHAAPGLIIAGADDLGALQLDPQRTLAGAPERDFRLLLVHNPDAALLVLERHRADVVLCGHTHGGQVRLPGARPIVLPVRAKQYWAGLYAIRGASMYVSRGFGWTHLPIRAFSQPEVTVHELRAPDA
jgi:predicted MPP superfamily phosphohydrolase